MDMLNKRRLSVDNRKNETIFLSTPDIYFQSQQDISRATANTTLKGDNLKNESLDSWFVLLSVVIFHIIMGYHYLAFGIYYVTFSETFQTTKATAGFISSIVGVSASGSSIFGSALIELFGIRKIAICGCIILSFAIFTSAFATSIYILYFTYGFIGGCGISLASLAAMVLIQEHFHKHRSFATSVAMCGLPVGNALSPIINNYFLNTFGWRGTLLMHSGILLNTVALAMTFWPVKAQLTRKVEPSFRNFLKSLCNSFMVLKIKPVIFFTVAIVFMRFNIATYFDHTPSRLFFLGYNLTYAGYTIAVIGIGILTSRIICSILMAFEFLDPFWGLGVASFVQSLVPLICPFFSYFLPIALLSGSFGLAQGFVAPTILLSMVKISGVANFAKTRAITNIFGGLANMVATPFTGWMFDITQNYDIPFFVGGSVGMLGFVCIVVTYLTHKMDIKKIPTENSSNSDYKNVSNSKQKWKKRMRTVTY